jgi:hypothetical protein
VLLKNYIFLSFLTDKKNNNSNCLDLKTVGKTVKEKKAPSDLIGLL